MSTGILIFVFGVIILFVLGALIVAIVRMAASGRNSVRGPESSATTPDSSDSGSSGSSD